MNINFYTWVHPSGYEYKFEGYKHQSLITSSSSSQEDAYSEFKIQCFKNKEVELAVRKEVNLKTFINDVYLAFKHIPYKPRNERILNLGYYLTESGIIIDGKKGDEQPIIEDSIKRALNLINKYGLVNSSKIVSDKQDFKRQFNLPEEFPSNDFTNDLQVVQENISEWESVIDKVMSMRFEENFKEKLIEVIDIKLTLQNNNIHLTPLTLLSAIDCSSFNKGISICGYCDAPFVQKRTNQEYCGNSCRASASRKRQSKD